MATVEQNLEIWSSSYKWREDGEEWSSPWGSAESQWWGSLFPRLHSFVPCNTILEIAPGFGRWTQFLKDLCQQLIVVDLTKRCIDRCQERFADVSHITYAVNDGKSLSMVADASVDFVFSFDSLVHAESDVLEAYLGQLANKLKPDGVGFIHHSNALRYRSYFTLARRLPRGRIFLARKGLLTDDHGRALSMSAELFARQCEQSGLKCLTQESINWGSKSLIDCISVFSRKGSRWDRPCRTLENRDFMREASVIRRYSGLYNGYPPRPKVSGRAETVSA